MTDVSTFSRPPPDGGGFDLTGRGTTGRFGSNTKPVPMKNIFQFLFVASLFGSCVDPAYGQTTLNVDTLEAQVVYITSDTVVTDDEILQMNIFDACRALGVNPDYDARYEHIIIPLCEQGVIMFPASVELLRLKDELKDSSVKRDENAPPIECLEYGGNGPQNATLIRNLVANKHLLKDGKLVPGAAKKWKVVK